MTYPPAPPARPRSRGFTLIEVMVTVVVLVVLVTIAYPNMQSLINGMRLSTATNSIIRGLQVARIEAVRRNARVALCASSDGSTCSTGSTRWSGWAVRADTNSDGTPDTMVQGNTFTAQIQVKSSGFTNNTVTFRADGRAYNASADVSPANGTVTVCVLQSRPTQNKRVVTLTAGSTVSTRSEGTGDKTCA